MKKTKGLVVGAKSFDELNSKIEEAVAGRKIIFMSPPAVKNYTDESVMSVSVSVVVQEA